VKANRLNRLLLLCVFLLSGCEDSVPGSSQFFGSNNYPERLSEWGLVWIDANTLRIAEDSFIYTLNTPLFSDYALKLRTLRIPKNQKATYDDNESFGFPVGTVVSKTFFYRSPNGQSVTLTSKWDGTLDNLDVDKLRLIETRLLVRQETGWEALPYIWRGDDAYLKVTGDLKELPITGTDEKIPYLVPSRNQCASCHVTDHTKGLLLPIGLKARHLNHTKTVDGENQLTFLQKTKQLSGFSSPADAPANADFNNSEETLDRRARAYLDINCSHCHNKKGPADTSALLLEHSGVDPRSYGVCKPPIASGRGSGGLLYSIVPGEAHSSIMPFRLGSRDPAEMMPELGRTLVHQEGLALINQWINSMNGRCI